jgi:hypothetical protein
LALRALLLALGVSACSFEPPYAPARKQARDDPLERATWLAMTCEWNLALSIVQKAREESSLGQRDELDAFEANVLRLALGRKRQRQRSDCSADALSKVHALGLDELRALALERQPLAECEVASGVDFIEALSQREDLELDRGLYLEFARAFERRHPALGEFWLARMEGRLHGPEHTNARPPEQAEADRLEKLRVCKLRSDEFEALSKLTRPEPITYGRSACNYRQ